MNKKYYITPEIECCNVGLKFCPILNFSMETDESDDLELSKLRTHNDYEFSDLDDIEDDIEP